MRTIEKTIYKFNELEKEVQEQIINKTMDDKEEFYCNYCLNDDMGSKASDLINDYFGITSDYLKVHYDLSYSQGSGAMVEFDINIEDLNNKYKIFSDEEMRFLTDKGIINTIEIRHNTNHYCHEYTFGITNHYYDMGYDYKDVVDEEYNITEEEFNTLEDRFYKLIDTYNMHYTESPFIKDIINVNRDLTRNGYEFIEYYCSAECMKDTIYELNNNDTEYYKNGSVYMGEE